MTAYEYREPLLRAPVVQLFSGTGSLGEGGPSPNLRVLKAEDDNGTKKD